MTAGFLKHPEGSVLVRCGDTMVVCTATVEDKVKDWLRGKGRGWVTAEYAMLPRANDKRGMREGQFGRWPSGRSQEIQRLIGRALRTGVYLERLGERTITIDCDVLQGDGGTRTASITGGFVALCLALDKLKKKNQLGKSPLRCLVAATSAGMVGGRALLDLDYREDSSAELDLNLAATDDGNVIELQATAETRAYPLETFHELSQLAHEGARRLFEIQRQTLTAAGVQLETLLDRGQGKTP
jgi:ribonuclease PH